MRPNYFARDGQVYRRVDRVFGEPEPCFLGLDVAERLLPLFEAHGDDAHFKPLATQLRQAIGDAKASHLEHAA